MASRVEHRLVDGEHQHEHHEPPGCILDGDGPCPLHHEIHHEIPHPVFWSATHVPHSPPTERPAPAIKCLPLNAPEVPGGMEVDEGHHAMDEHALEAHALETMHNPAPTWSIHPQPDAHVPHASPQPEPFRFVHADESHSEWHTVQGAAPAPPRKVAGAVITVAPAGPAPETGDERAVPRIGMSTPPASDPGPGPFSPARFCPIGESHPSQSASPTEMSPCGPRPLRPSEAPPPLCSVPAGPIRRPHGVSGFGTPTGRGTPTGAAAAVAAAAALAGTQRSFSPAPGGPSLVPHQGPVPEAAGQGEGARRGRSGGAAGDAARAEADAGVQERGDPPAAAPQHADADLQQPAPARAAPAAMPTPRTLYRRAAAPPTSARAPLRPIPSGPSGSAAGLVRPTPRDPAFAAGGRPRSTGARRSRRRCGGRPGAARGAGPHAPPEQTASAPAGHSHGPRSHPESSPCLAAARTGPQPGAFRPAIPELPSPR
eukprot:tig00001003_g6263.t1